MDNSEQKRIDTLLESGNNEIALKNALREGLKCLNELEAKVIKMRFGLMDGQMHTLEEVGKYMGLSRDRIRQIENKAVRKLRYSTGHCAKRIIWEEPEIRNPDDALTQCIQDNGIVVGNPAQFSLCAVGISEEINMSLITRGNHTMVNVCVNAGNKQTQATLNFIHFSAQEPFEVVLFSAEKSSMVAQIEKKSIRNDNFRITPIKIYCDDPALEVFLCTSMPELCASMAKLALSALNQVLKTKCNGLALKDFGYSNYE